MGAEGGSMKRKTYRIKMMLEGDKKEKIYRTDGVPTHCCSFQINYFTWEKNTKYNRYAGWNGYVSQRIIEKAINRYNPDGLTI
jgi:hypothetical protein